MKFPVVRKEHMGLVTLCTPTIELLWHWRWLKKLEVAPKHCISVLPFFPFFLLLFVCVFSELPGVPRACNFLFSESPIFLQLRALCPTACDSVLTNRYCPVGRMVAGTKELLSGFYSNPGSEIYEWTFRTVMWITSAQNHATKAELLGCPLPSFVIRGRNIPKLSFYPLLISHSIPTKHG